MLLVLSLAPSPATVSASRLSRIPIQQHASALIPPLSLRTGRVCAVPPSCLHAICSFLPRTPVSAALRVVDVMSMAVAVARTLPCAPSIYAGMGLSSGTNAPACKPPTCWETSARTVQRVSTSSTVPASTVASARHAHPPPVASVANRICSSLKPEPAIAVTETLPTSTEDASVPMGTTGTIMLAPA